MLYTALPSVCSLCASINNRCMTLFYLPNRNCLPQYLVNMQAQLHCIAWQNSKYSQLFDTVKHALPTKFVPRLLRCDMCVIERCAKRVPASSL